MIQVIYFRKQNRVTIKGHADSGDTGHDLVCAGASILAYTLAANVQNLAQQGYVRDVLTSLEPGNAEIWCKSTGSKSVVEMIFDAVCVGYEMLAKEQPEYISYEIHG